MNTKPVLVTAILALSTACASGPSRRDSYQAIVPGASKADVMAAMGHPDAFRTESGKEIYLWGMDDFEGCGISFDSKDRVVGKECRVNEEARAQADASRRAYIQRATQVNIAPMEAYQVPIQRSRSCRTNWIGGTAHTNCD